MDRRNMTALPGSEKRPAAGARLIGDIDPEHLKTVTVVVRRKAGAVLPPVASGVRLTREELATTYGADAEEMSRVEEWLVECGLTILHADAADRTIIARGRTADVLAAFDVTLRLYSAADASVFTGREGVISVPAELSGIIEAVLGIDDRPAARPQQSPELAAPTVGMTAPVAAARYNFPLNLTGDGVCVGIIELGGGYKLDDIADSLQAVGINAKPQITAVGVNGGINNPGPDFPVDVEVALDVELVAAVAPAARIAVYFARNDSDAEFINAMNCAVHDQVRQPSVISISWGAPEEKWTPQALQTFDDLLHEAALLGITVLAASGDHGSADEELEEWDGNPHVSFPAAHPLVVACGGTEVVTQGGVTTDVVWNSGPSLGTGGGGGGVSRVFGLPAYQQAAGVPLSPAGGSGRGVPDVSGHAVRWTVHISKGQMTTSGTSAVAPLYAGLMALINEERLKRGAATAGLIHDTLYATAGMCRDVTQGDNDVYGSLAGLYTAQPGWDAASGLGCADGVSWLAAFAPPPAVHIALPPGGPQPHSEVQ